MLKYILGLIYNLLNPAVGLFMLIDNKSKVSKKAKVYNFTQIYKSKIEDYTYISRYTAIVNADIGKYCSIASKCTIGLGRHTLNNISSSPIFTQRNNALKKRWTDFQEENLFQPISIGNDVWIGARAIIMSGIEIGDGAVIGAGAIVTHNVPPYSIVVGVPAKVIRYRFTEKQINLLEEIKWWNMDEETLKSNIAIFQRPISDEILEDFIQMHKNGISQ